MHPIAHRPNQPVCTIIGETKPIDWSAPHKARYAATKYSDRTPSSRFRIKAAKESTIGVAGGSIMAAVMTDHIAEIASPVGQRVA
jgi:hypothetical protein